MQLLQKVVYICSQMTKEVIIKSVFLNKSLHDFARKTTKHNDLWQDIISEMIIYLNDMDEAKLVELYRSEGILNYCYKIIYLSWNSPNSPFYKKYRTTEGEDFIGQQQDVEHYDIEIDLLYTRCIKSINDITDEISIKRYPTESRIFELYAELGSVRKTAKKLRLPVMTVWSIIDQFKTKIKSKL